MSYIQVEIGGKLRGLKYNQFALEAFHKHLDFNAISASSAYATFYAGLTANCYVKREEVDFTFEDVVEWVDTLMDEGKEEIIQAVDKCFSDTQTFKRFIETTNKQIEEKKKMIELT